MVLNSGEKKSRAKNMGVMGLNGDQGKERWSEFKEHIGVRFLDGLWMSLRLQGVW